jgi:ubiquinone/menaquinone biosynthesis C-methylase UbiE
MDEPGLAPAEVIAAYRVLERVNRQLGHLQSLKRELRRSLAEDRFDQRSMTLLDVGSGSGDLPSALCKLLDGRAIRGVAFALDRDSTAVQLAASRGLIAVQGDALHLPFPDRSLDLVTAVKFAHHFKGAGLTRLVSEMARVARCRVIILDIRRHWLAYWGFRAWSRLFTRSRLVRYDGPLSVLRGFTRDELADLGAPVPGFLWTVRSYAGFQLALIGRRSVGSG